MGDESGEYEARWNRVINYSIPAAYLKRKVVAEELCDESCFGTRDLEAGECLLLSKNHSQGSSLQWWSRYNPAPPSSARKFG